MWIIRQQQTELGMLPAQQRLHVRQPPQRIQSLLQVPDRPPLFSELAPQLEPVEGAVFPGLKREPHEYRGADDPDDPRARHNPYRWRPGYVAVSPSSSAMRSS